jgi:hypothetical protein
VSTYEHLFTVFTPTYKGAAPLVTRGPDRVDALPARCAAGRAPNAGVACLA